MTMQQLLSAATGGEQDLSTGSQDSIWRLAVIGKKMFTIKGRPMDVTDTLKAKQSLLMQLKKSCVSHKYGYKQVGMGGWDEWKL